MTFPLGSSAAWAAWRKACVSGPCILAFDFDGTLAAIAAEPGLASFDSGLRRLLSRLGRLEGVTIAVLSGRGMRDLRQKVALPGAILFSNHGLDCSLKGLAPSGVQRARWRRLAALAKSRLQPLLRGQSGAWLEDKGLDLSLHVRSVIPRRRRAILAGTRRALRGLPLSLRMGKMALEIRPDSPENKGVALLRLIPKSGPSTFCLFAGDDRTDEDAFKSMRALRGRGLSVKIGKGPTAAKARLPRRGLSGLLKRLCLARLQQGGL